MSDTQTDQTNERVELPLFQAGKEVVFALPRFASPLRPRYEDLRVAAKTLDIPITKARKALGFYMNPEGFPPETTREKLSIIKVVE